MEALLYTILNATMAFGIAIISVVIAIGVAILVKMGKLTSIDDGIKRFNSVIDGLLVSSFGKGTSSDLAQRVEKIEEHLKRLNPKGNPISSGEIERFRSYNGKIREGMPLNYEEYTDYRQLGERIKQQLPKKQRTDFDLLLAGVFGFVAGMALAELIRSLSQR